MANAPIHGVRRPGQSGDSRLVSVAVGGLAAVSPAMLTLETAVATSAATLDVTAATVDQTPIVPVMAPMIAA